MVKKDGAMSTNNEMFIQETKQLLSMSKAHLEKMSLLYDDMEGIDFQTEVLESACNHFSDIVLSIAYVKDEIERASR